jgi:hydroxymethylpyrimidine kinase/phosphomethylpyrimidine kinase/thiamine-phosphate diphosphorylase
MLPTVDIIRSICDVLKTYHVKALVVDPVLVATSGDELAGPAVLDVLREELLPMADLVTPNLPEASALIGGENVVNISDMREAAQAIHALGPRNVLVKGGHLPGTGGMVDVLYDGVDWHELSGSRVETHNTHGTGCTLASAIAAELAKGLPMLPAILAAKQYLADTLQQSAGLNIGRGAQGPLNHLYKLSNWGKTSTERQFKPEALLLYAVTDAAMNKRWGRSTADAVRGAIEGGATIIQIREKEAETGEFLREAEASLKVARHYGIPLLINDRIDIAMACDADGIHLGQSDLPVAQARALLGPDKIIGVSCKTPEQAEKAWKDGADYVGSGGVYPTTTKKDNKTIGLDGLREVCYGSPIPVVAIGGISTSNAGQVMQEPRPQNLKGVAVVSALFNQADVVASTQALRSVLARTVKESSPVVPLL